MEWYYELSAILATQYQYTGGSSQRMGKLSSAFEKANTSAAYPYGLINFVPALGIHFRIANSRT